MNLKQLAVAVVAVAGFANAGVTRADDYDHMEPLVHQLQTKSKKLYKEVHMHLPGVSHPHKDTKEMERLANHLHDLIHRRENTPHVREEVSKLAKLTHHVEEQIDDLARSGRHDFSTIQHLRMAVRQIDRIAHHLAEHVN